MDYKIELQRITDCLKTDRGVDPKWRNKLVARLEEIIAMSHMLTNGRAPLPEAPPDLEQITAGMIPTLITDLPIELQKFANPNQLS